MAALLVPPLAQLQGEEQVEVQQGDAGHSMRAVQQVAMAVHGSREHAAPPLAACQDSWIHASASDALPSCRELYLYGRCRHDKGWGESEEQQGGRTAVLLF